MINTKDYANVKEFQNCLKEACKLTHGEYYPELDNLSRNTVFQVVEKCKDEMCVLVENINWGESNHRKVPVVLQRKYDKFMSKWDKEIYWTEEEEMLSR